MPTIRAIHSVGNSIANYLQRSYPADLHDDFPCSFQLASGAELAGEEGPTRQATLFLYRIGLNPHLRHTTRRDPFTSPRAPLALDLHYLLTVWQDSALAEQTIIGWAMRQLDEHAILDSSFLSPEGGWAADESIQLLPDDLTSQDLFHIWDRLRPSYRLSVGYVARVVRIDGVEEPDHLPVVGARFDYDPSYDGKRRREP